MKELIRAWLCPYCKMPVGNPLDKGAGQMQGPHKKLATRIPRGQCIIRLERYLKKRGKIENKAKHWVLKRAIGIRGHVAPHYYGLLDKLESQGKLVVKEYENGKCDFIYINTKREAD